MGTFVPEDKKALKQTVMDLLSRSEKASALVPSVPLAILAPHAGLDYSGALAGAAWQMTANLKPDRIAILSPCHTASVQGLALPGDHNAIALPGLRVRIDREACSKLVKAKQAKRNDAPFEAEHGIDTHIPFARSVHAGVPVVPIVVGDATPQDVADAINTLETLPGQTLFVLSSDLSHFLAETEAQKRDVRTSGLIEIGAGQELTAEDACGARVIAGFLASDIGQRARAMRLGRHTSSRHTGDTERVVGYGAWAFFEGGDPVFGPLLQREILGLARKALQSRLDRGTDPQVRVDSFAPPLRGVMASFVSLQQNGRLRGCIGSLFPFRPLVADIASNAAKAGFADQRFAPLAPADMDSLQITVSVLTRPQPLLATDRAEVAAALVPGQTGLIVQEGEQRGVLLPSVWASLPEPEQFLSAVLRKAGLPEDHWSDSLRFHRFQAESFAEENPATSVAA